MNIGKNANAGDQSDRGKNDRKLQRGCRAGRYDI